MAPRSLDTLDLSVAPGEAYGYLGPNGAGKTTTIRLLLGLHRPSAGGAQLFGRPIDEGTLQQLRHLSSPAGSRSPAPSPTARRFACSTASRRDLLTVSGYAAWRVGGTLAIFAAIFGLRAAVRALRTEEDAGRTALERGGAVVGLLFLLRVIADTAGGVGWLRWAKPLGWAEELRPFAGAHPLALAPPLAARSRRSPPRGSSGGAT
jgi:energy-coupling factor transporter ATP-binding protein EcfA2